ncbi:tyrosine-type recombinase/integrase [Eubacterium sp.]|uniref:tyrosine-type recombinase/integrase n=1 Tax=Eubacterium sp. TaxID=142586 RepID=UPI002FC87B7C
MKNAPTSYSQPDITLSELLMNFLFEKEVEGISKNTIKLYNIHITSFINSISAKKASAITKKDYHSFIKSLKDSNTKDVTIASYCRSVRVFLYYGMEVQNIQYFKITIPKYQKTIKQIYSNEELSLLLKTPNIKKCTFTEYKTWVFENIIISTGLRLSSVLNLQIQDIDLSENSFTINNTKNKNPTKAYFNQEMALILSKYLKYRGGNSDDYLICTDTGNKISLRTMQGNVKRYNNSRGVSKTSIHLFRHTFAKNAVLAGIDVFTLMRMMQHSDIQTTLNYVKILNVDAKRSCEVYNPQKQFEVNKKQIKPKGGPAK